MIKLTTQKPGTFKPCDLGGGTYTPSEETYDLYVRPEYINSICKNDHGLTLVTFKDGNPLIVTQTVEELLEVL